MGTGVCLKGTKMYPLSTAGLLNLMMYILIEMLLSFKIKLNILCEKLIFYFNITFCTEPISCALKCLNVDFGELNWYVYPNHEM